MVQSILEQVSMKTEGVMNRYSSIYLRKQVINHGLNNIEIQRPFLEKNIKEIYGLGEGVLVLLVSALILSTFLSEKYYDEDVDVMCDQSGLLSL